MKSLAAVCGKTVHMYDAVTGKETWLVSRCSWWFHDLINFTFRTLTTDKAVRLICFSPDGSMLAVGGQKEKLDVRLPLHLRYRENITTKLGHRNRYTESSLHLEHSENLITMLLVGWENACGRVL